MVIVKQLIKFLNIFGAFIPKLIGGLVIVTVFISVPAAIADPVTARGSERDGIARMSFTWPIPVPFLARVQNKEIVIQFARPAEGDFNRMVKALNKYIRPPRVQNGGRVLIFPLVGNFDLNYFSKNIKCVPNSRKSIQTLSNCQYYDSKSSKLTHFETCCAPETQILKYLKHLLASDTSRKNTENP